MPFGADVSIANPPSPWRSTALNLTPSHPLVHLPLQAAVPPDVGGTRLLRGSDEESDDRALSDQSIGRANHAQPKFECCICMKEIPTDSITPPDSCGHVAGLFDEYEVIGLCPACNAAKGKGKASGTQGGTCRPQVWTLQRLIM